MVKATQQVSHRSRLLLSYFFNRCDVVAVGALANGGPCPGVPNDPQHLERLVYNHVAVNGHAIGVKSRTGELLTGIFRLGSYNLGPGNKGRWLCFDCDGGPGHPRGLKDPLDAALLILTALASLGVAAHLEMSGGGHGWHVWVLFKEPVPGTKLIALAQLVLPQTVELVDGSEAPGTDGIEIFPKQAETDDLGCLVWLPLWGKARGHGNQFFRVAEEGEVAPYEPANLATVSEADLDRALSLLGGSEQDERNDQAGITDDTWEHLLERAVKGEIKAEWARSGRNARGLWLAQQLLWNGCAYESAKALMRAFAQRVGGEGGHRYTEREAIRSLDQARKMRPREATKTRGDSRPDPPLLKIPPWPKPLDAAAYHGIVGEFVRLIEPASEADPAALLFQFLIAFGSLAGRNAYFLAEADRHYPNEFIALMGKTSKGRKGSSWGRVLEACRAADEQWANNRVATGLSSGEGLIWEVRDAIYTRQKVKQRNGPTTYEDVQTDPGISDKRTLVMEPELANVLRQAERNGNTLSPVIRSAWETGNLRSMTKNSPARASGAHISIIGHITIDELRRYLTSTEISNGFANRFIFVCVRRSKELPEGGYVDAEALSRIYGRVRQALEFSKQPRRMERDPEARDLWVRIYGQLSADRPGLSGSILARSEAHVMRLAMIYALLDQSELICREHLKAALALWDYSTASVRHVFGDSLGDPVADEILGLLKENPGGLSRNQIRDYFQRNQPSERIARALALLVEHNLIVSEERKTQGRPATIWKARCPTG
jgi:hypothetical protein